MLEQIFSVNDHGIVYEQPRFLPLTTAVRLVVQVIKRLRPSYELDFNQPGWASLKNTVEVRSRLVHPKTLADLEVSENEVKDAMAAFKWMLALVVELLDEAKTYVSELRAAGWLVVVEGE